MGLIRILVGLFLVVLFQNPVHAVTEPVTEKYSLTLGWNPSPSPGVVGCRLYYGTASGEYTDIVETGNETTATVSGLAVGITYFFAITAVDGDGDESNFSDEISYQQALLIAPTVQMQIQPVADGQFMLTVTGPAGRTYDIEATEDFASWTVIGTGTLDETGSLDFTDSDAASFPKRFYRAHDPLSGVPKIPGAQLQIQAVAGGQFRLTLTGPVGHTYDIEATENFVTWTVIGTGTLGASGSLQFTDTNAANFAQRFYRAHEVQLGAPKIPLAQMQSQGVSEGQFRLTVTGPVGRTYDIEATEDLVNWTVIGRVILDASGSVDFTDTDAANHPQRFYRTRDAES